MTREDIAGAAYALAGMITFGWSASDPSHACDATCYANGECFEVADRALSGVAAGVFWPVYWTWVAAEYVRGEHDG